MAVMLRVTMLVLMAVRRSWFVLMVVRSWFGTDDGMFVDPELGRGDAGAQDAVRMHVRIAEREAAERGFQIVEREAGVEHRAQRHVARDPGEAVEVENTAHS